MRTVVLTGLSGAGKSTAGPLVALALGCDFVDLDREIERRAGMAVADIFAVHGEAHFRRLEAEALSDAMSRTRPAVVALGGGALVDPESRRLALARGTVVWLRVSPEAAAARCATEGGRPLLAGADGADTLRRLLAAREAAYAQAHHVVETDGVEAGDVARRILAAVGGAA